MEYLMIGLAIGIGLFFAPVIIGLAVTIGAVILGIAAMVIVWVVELFTGNKNNYG